MLISATGSRAQPNDANAMMRVGSETILPFHLATLNHLLYLGSFIKKAYNDLRYCFVHIQSNKKNRKPKQKYARILRLS